MLIVTEFQGNESFGAERRKCFVSSRRVEYQSWIRFHYEIADCDKSKEDLDILRQIRIDIPRSAPGIHFLHQPIIQRYVSFSSTLSNNMYVKIVFNHFIAC